MLPEVPRSTWIACSAFRDGAIRDAGDPDRPAPSQRGRDPGARPVPLLVVHAARRWGPRDVRVACRPRAACAAPDPAAAGGEDRRCEPGQPRRLGRWHLAALAPTRRRRRRRAPSPASRRWRRRPPSPRAGPTSTPAGSTGPSPRRRSGCRPSRRGSSRPDGRTAPPASVPDRRPRSPGNRDRPAARASASRAPLPQPSGRTRAGPASTGPGFPVAARWRASRATGPGRPRAVPAGGWR